MTLEQQTFEALPPYPESIRFDFLRVLVPFDERSLFKALLRMSRRGLAERCGVRCYRRTEDAAPPDDRRGGKRQGAGRKRKA